MAYLSLGESIQDVINKLKNEREHKKIKQRLSVQSSLDGVGIRWKKIAASGKAWNATLQAGCVITLQLDYEALSGTIEDLSMISSFICLKKLNLAYNSLSGSIPPSLFSLPSLQQLKLSNNNFSGHIDEFHSSSFPHLEDQSSLLFLDLSNNRLRDEIPNWIWEIGSGDFWQLNLSCNHFVDLQKPYRIPDSLQVLDLHSNHLGGELPLPKERALYIDYSNNKFDKAIPTNIGTYLSNLIFFSVSNNSLSGTIPSTLCEAAYLQVVDLSFNNLSGNIHPCLLQNTENLGVFSLRSNNISGDIPDEFSENCDLETLDFNGNNLGGKIPKSMEYCTSLTVFNVGDNNIDGGFPCMLPSSLRVLVLRSNKFHGEITCTKHWPDLQIMDISSNYFSGSLNQVGFSSWSRMVLGSDRQSRREQLHFDFLNLKNFYYQDEVTLTIKGSKLKLP
ncbi:receptor like protein 27-like [Salvia splendens]|uniref:receptor like protein 27-like n=1 Tax=Salvia splendens TaxID=180675 RepID=UPI001C25923B|nr:receptor like protein 27-like [Salvia splendens]